MKIDFIFNVIQNISIIIASFTAIYGINSWRREARWKRKYELAEEVLFLFYECKEKISIIRNPVSYVGEGKTRKRAENETAEETEILDMAYVFLERYVRERESFTKLNSLKFRCVLVFDKNIIESFDEITNIINEIILAANRLGNRYWKDQGSKNFEKHQFEKHLVEMHKHESIVWATYDNEDEVQERINKSIEKIEAYCLSIIKH